MKKIFCLAFVLLAAFGVLAQEKTIEKTEFDAVMRLSFKKYAGQSYRRTENSEEISGETNQSKVNTKLVMEFAGRQEMRSIIEFNSPTLKKKTERIMIDGKSYTRIDDGEWTQTDVKGSGIFSAPLKTIEDQTEYKSLGTEKLDGQNTTVYAKIQRQKRVNESNGNESSVIITTKRWFGEDGGILKQETVMENRIKSAKNPVERVFRHLSTEVWEIDPNIKIEAPIAGK